MSIIKVTHLIAQIALIVLCLLGYFCTIQQCSATKIGVVMIYMTLETIKINVVALFFIIIKF